MTQKKSSKKEPEVEIEKEAAPEAEAPEIEVRVEDDVPSTIPAGGAKTEPPRQEEDVEALRQQLEALQIARDASKNREAEAERRAQQAAAQLAAMRQSAEASQYDSVVTMLGAAQMEVDSAKRDIVLAGAAQDYAALADAQERLAAAKAHMVGLEQSKNNYEAQAQNPPKPTIEQMIDANTNLSWDERNWLKQHPEAMTDPGKNARLNAAYYEAMDKNLQRGSRDYFEFIEEKLGYREKTKQEEAVKQQVQVEESPIMVAAPPSKSVPEGSGAGGKKNVFTLTKEEAEIAKLAGITPQEYVKQRELLVKQKRINPGDYPER